MCPEIEKHAESVQGRVSLAALAVAFEVRANDREEDRAEGRRLAGELHHLLPGELVGHALVGEDDREHRRGHCNAGARRQGQIILPHRPHLVLGRDLRGGGARERRTGESGGARERGQNEQGQEEWAVKDGQDDGTSRF